MRHSLRVLALALLPLGSCAGYIGWGYAWCDPYYDPYCVDYYYDSWDPHYLTAADFDGDGALDLAVSDGQAGKVWIVPGLLGGGFAGTPLEAFTSAYPPNALAALHANGDAHPDLLVLDGNPGTLDVYLGDGHGGFAPAPPALNAAAVPVGVRFATGPIDGDAVDDLAFVDQDGGVHVLLGQGNGTFLDAGHGDPASAFLGPDAAARRDGIHLLLSRFDERPGTDLLVMDGERATFAVLSGNGDGTFAPGSSAGFSSLGDVISVAPVFVRSGGQADLAVLFCDTDDPSAVSSLAVLRVGDGSSITDPAIVDSARSLFARDLDGDGVTDLLLSDLTNLTVRALHARRN